MTTLFEGDWDTIVVGAGSAGAPLAARLSEDGARRVLLLEAGPDLRVADMPPAMHAANGYAMVADDRFVWGGLTAHVTDAREPEPLLVGRVAGGGSAINGQGIIRPLAGDLDRWAAAGASGWSAAELAPLLARIESDLSFGTEPGHGKEGPVPVWHPPRETWNPVDRAFEEAARAAGHAPVRDVNAPDAEGVAPFPANRRDGLRYSTALAYLEPARARPSLHVAGDAEVRRVSLEGRRAVGVEVVVDGRPRAVRGREVVLCTGAVLSPALLWRSGIGPAGDLERLGLPVVADLPAGRHLLEHPIAFLTLHLRESERARSDSVRTTSCCARYSSGHPGCDPGDMWLWGMGSAGHAGRPAELGLLGASVFQSFSEGVIELDSPDWTAPPRVRMRLLSDARDLHRLRDGARRLAQLAAHPALARIATRWELRRLWDGTGAPPSDRALDDWLLESCRPGFHVAGTCRMGAADDPRAVVDPRARVRGIAGLRVADASIMPAHVRANPHLTAVLIGERVAELVRSDAGG